MTALKSERLVNLTILLLVANTPLSKEQIRNVTEPYRNAGTEAFEKMFERDKDDLRELGIPIEVRQIDPLFGDEIGYRIRRDAFELPPIDFTAEEVAVLGLAARVWENAGLAEATSEALLKLKAGGLDVDRGQLGGVQPSLSAEEASFPAMWQAVTSRTPVAFAYQKPGAKAATQRHLQPWGAVTVEGRWYVVGWDTDRGAERMFRLSRVTSEVLPTGRAGSFTVPEGTDVRALSAQLAPRPEIHEAICLIPEGAALGLRRRAETVEEPVAGPDGSHAWTRLRVRYGDHERFASDLLGEAEMGIVEGPPELREQVLRRLGALVDPAGAGGGGA